MKKLTRVFLILIFVIFSLCSLVGAFEMANLAALASSRTFYDLVNSGQNLVVEGGDVDIKPSSQGAGLGYGLKNVRSNNSDLDPQLSGGQVRFLANQSSDSQQLAAVFQSSDGHVIVVDGGVAEDEDHLINVIQSFGGHVDCWLITHPHRDHVGALTGILNSQDTSITVDDYYFSLLDQGWYDENDSDEAGISYLLREALYTNAPSDRLHNGLSAGTTVSLSENLSFTIVNNALKIPGIFAGNSSGIIYDIDIDGQHFLMLGDMSQVGGDAIMDSGLLDDIHCDYVQIAHHGQAGVSGAFYRRLAPKYCIWPTNSYIYYGGASYDTALKTAETIDYISSLRSVRANYITLSADVIIR